MFFLVIPVFYDHSGHWRFYGLYFDIRAVIRRHVLSSITLDETFDIIVISMRDAFLAVTVFVAAMVLLFSWLQYISAGKFVLWIRENSRIQPLIGAFMGLTPGCGGAIIVMPMYTKGYVTYGTVVATLIATLGDAAFVLIGAVFQDISFLAPVIAVHLISFVVAVIWGFAVDRFHDHFTDSGL